MSDVRHRRGIALVSALTLLALLGLLLAGAVAAMSLAQHATSASLWEGPLLGAADFAVSEVLMDPAASGLPDLPLGQPVTTTIAAPAADLSTSVVATRLPQGIYWLVARANVAGAERAQRRVNLIGRTAWLGRVPGAPFVARGPTTLAADVVVLNDSIGEPDCAVVAAPPPILTDDSASVFDASGIWSRLADATGVRVVHGDTTLTSGVFEGILMVGGTLTVDGAVDLRGLVVARGRIRSTAGLHVTGALVSQAAGPGPSIDLHGATVRYSPCLVSRLLRRASPIRVVRGWGWTELF